MVLELTIDQISHGSPPDGHRTTRQGDELLVHGHPVGAEETFVAVGDGRLHLSHELGPLLASLGRAGRYPPVSNLAISHMLHHAFVPLPHTNYVGVWSVGIGDTAHVSTSGTMIRSRFEHEYPWLAALSPQDQLPDDQHLLSLLTTAVTGQVGSRPGSGFLMMSSGKDSVAIAVALAEAGLTNVRCVSYQVEEEDPEPPVAAAICRQLGLDHVIVAHPAPGPKLEETLIDFFTHSERPCADPALLPYVLCVSHMQPRGGFVLDGGGNDGYMGFLPHSRDRLKQAVRVRGSTLRRLLTALTPFDSPLNYVIRSRIETTFSLRTVRYQESSRFFQDCVDTHPYWTAESRKLRHLDALDIKSVRARHGEQSKSMLKLRLAAGHGEARALMPFCDAALAEYCFGLPEEARYNRSRGINKLLLRQMLESSLGYDAEAVGKHTFGFDGGRFLIENRDFVLNEIKSCSLWNQRAGAFAAAVLDRLRRRRFGYHALLVLFQVSAWHNHSRFAPGAGTTGRSTAWP